MILNKVGQTIFFRNPGNEHTDRKLVKKHILGSGDPLKPPPNSQLDFPRNTFYVSSEKVKWKKAIETKMIFFYFMEMESNILKLEMEFRFLSYVINIKIDKCRSIIHLFH